MLAASGAKSTVADILSNMAASADVLALAKIEVEMKSIPEGESRPNFMGFRREWTGKSSWMGSRDGLDCRTGTPGIRGRESDREG